MPKAFDPWLHDPQRTMLLTHKDGWLRLAVAVAGSFALAVALPGQGAEEGGGRVGQGAIVGGLSAVTRDVIPYGSAWGNHVRLHGLNLIGLKRKGYGKDAVRRLLAAYRDLFEGEGVFAERLDRVEATYADLPEIMEIVAFIRDGGKRPLCLPGE